MQVEKLVDLAAIGCGFEQVLSAPSNNEDAVKQLRLRRLLLETASIRMVARLEPRLNVAELYSLKQLHDVMSKKARVSLPK